MQSRPSTVIWMVVQLVTSVKRGEISLNRKNDLIPIMDPENGIKL